MGFSSELARQRCSLGNAVSLINISNGEHAGHKYFAHYRPLVQSRRALKGDADTIKNGRILFLAAAYQSCLFIEELIRLAADHETEHFVNHSLDLRRDRIPIDRAGEHKCVRSQDIVRDGVEIVVEGAGLSGLVAGLAGMTEIQLQRGGVDDLYFISLCCSSLSECLSHSVAVAAFSGTSGKNKDLFGHGLFPPVNSIL